MSNDQKLQILLVGVPVLSLVGIWLSLRTYGRMVQRNRSQSFKRPQQPVTGSDQKMEKL